MAQSTFPWSTQESTTAPATDIPSPRSRFGELREKIKTFAPLILLAIILITLFCLRRPASTPREDLTPQTEVLVTLIDLPKGSALVPEILRLVSFDKRSLSKKQILTRVLSQDIEALKGRIRAKRDIPPNQILFWDDIEFFKNPIKAAEIKIYFPKEMP